MEIARRLDEYAARQYGVVTRSQAYGAGMTDTMISARLHAGRWIRLASGVYAYASAPPKWERQIAAAVLSRPRAYVAGRSAAYLHGFSGYRPGRPEILLPADGNARSPLARVVRDSHFEEIATTRAAGLEATTVAETIWTLARSTTTDQLARLVDSQMSARTIRVDAFDPILARIDGERRPGAPRLRKLLVDRRFDAYQPPTSALEAHLYPLLDSPGIPLYTRQCPIRLDDQVRAVLDAYIPLWRLIVEADGPRPTA